MSRAPYILAQPMQQAFTGGELSPLLNARPDQARYTTGARRMRNMVCIPQGAAMRRSGLRFLGTTAAQSASASGAVRIIPFVFSLTQTRILELGGGYMRVWRGDSLLKKSDGTPYSIPTPYSAEHVQDLRVTQIADVVYITHRGYRPRKLSRHADTDWRLEEINFMPRMQPPGAISVEYRQTATPPNGSRDHTYVVTTIGSDGEESVSSPSKSVSAPPLTDQNPVRVTWSSVPGAVEYRIYKKQSGVFGFVGRVNAKDSDQFFDDYNILPDMADSPPNAKDPFVGADNYPALVFSWQQRLGFSSTAAQPLTVWLSPIGVFESMAASVPPGEADAIEFTISGSQQHSIQWVLGEKTLLIGTEGTIVSVNAGSDEAGLTPKNIKLSVEQSCGASSVEAISAGGAVLMAHASGTTVREITYNFSSDGYQCPDLALLAEHIFQNRRILRMAWQQMPWAVLWCLLDNGTLAACTYMREHDIIGWHVHETDGQVEDICTVPGFTESALYALVRRQNAAGSFLALEKLAPFFRSGKAEDSFFVDSGLSYQGVPAKVFSGLGHLEGRELHIMADGYAVPPAVVKDGRITLESAASTVHMGLPFVAELEPTRPEFALQSGNTMTRVRKITGAVLRLYQSMAVKAGSRRDKLREVITHAAADPVYPAMVSGDYQVTIDSGWIAEGVWGKAGENDTHLVIRSGGPTPLCVLGIVYNCDIAASTGVQI